VGHGALLIIIIVVLKTESNSS